MIKVLIVDDEPKLREGLRTLIPWEEQGYTVVATAANGIEALEKFHTFAPKLVIADIRMPGMDGLELINELRKEKADCHIMILSGYADFEYAKKAISLHIDGYLLKPVDEEELLSYLQELRVTISRKEQLDRLHNAMPSGSSETLLRELLQPREGGESADEIVDALELEERSCEVVLLELKHSAKGEEDKNERVRQLLERRLGGEQGLFFTMPPYMGILLNRPLRDEAARTALWRQLKDIVSQEEIGFVAAAGGAVERPQLAGVSFAAARERLGEAFFARKDMLIYGEPEARDVQPLRQGTDPEDQDRDAAMELLLAVETGSEEAIPVLISEIIRQTVEAKRDETVIKDSLIRLLSTTIARLEAANPDIRAWTDVNPSPAADIFNSYYLTEVEDRLVEYLSKLSRQLSSGGRGDEIKRITDLIQRRYNENLKLGTLAELFNYNSAYLGKMFKLQVGEHFNTYLDKVRIEKAKQFLAQGMKVYEVAEKVGYMNSDYFNAKFRKYVGVSPSAFRKEQ
ncbi:response regulator transcription factor ['Paenibacillus yunnanensis' Narsing Rao et al. 2020]|uniref:response regulator transcription factor n=1 Tax=Paenibacillus tengchongensis TaxID=2608684 RepID=UPI00124F3582|nr:response regulator transcription factor [Paenibacillus tengchongensis]